MSVAKNLDEIIESLEKAQTPGLSVKDCGHLEKDGDCGCEKKTKRLKVAKGKVQEMAYCKKCRGELGKCECLRKGDDLSAICNDCGLPVAECECKIPAKVEKRGLDALIDMLGKLG